MKKCLFLVSLVFFTLANSVSAQGISETINPQLLIELSPAFPQPGEEVTARINDYSSTVYGSTITWLIDGEEVPDAQNFRETKIIAGDLGERTQITVLLETPFTGVQRLDTFIQPAYLDIILEPQTRVPDNYLGRSLPSLESVINATALLYDGSFRNDLVYTWRMGRTVIEGGPIRGRNQVSFDAPLGKEGILSVQVTDSRGQVLGRRAIRLPSEMPMLKFYEVSTLLGMSNMPIQEGGYSIIGNTGTVKAEPFFLDSRVYNDPDILEWEIGNQRTGNVGGNPYEITLQRNENGGTASLNFHVRDTSQVLQGVEDDILINF